VEFVGALGALEAGVERERDRQAQLLSQIERAAELSIAPLRDMLRGAGVNVERIIEELRRETGGAGGPFIPASYGPDAETAPDPAASVIAGLEHLALLQTAARRMPFGAPVANPRITSGFGTRRDPFNRRLARHDGIDFAGPTGTPILAPADGVVVFAGVQSGYGRMVKIRHQFGFETLYAHLSRVRVAQGQTVRRGMRIGDMGNTGRSTGTHLHYEVHVDGKPVNPRKFIEAARNVL
jgi:murein DD-endopeptidase MepM/ murein hydrolase activator NlpD